jgi:UDP-glucose 4-epimerase
MTEHVLLTGATGYLGGQLFEWLEKKGFVVTVLNRRPLAAVKSRLVGAVAAAQPRPPILIHLAGIAGRTRCTAEASSEAVRFACEAISLAKEMGADRAILGSSIYASLAEQGRHSAYGEHKLEIERAFASEFSGEVVTLRLPPVYGGKDDASSITRLASLVGRRVPLPLGLANARRDYLALENFLQLVTTIARSPRSHAPRESVYEPSDGSSVTTCELARLLGWAVYDRPPLLIPVPGVIMRLLGGIAGKGELVQAAFDPLTAKGNTSLSRDFGWVPTVTMPASLDYLRPSR